MDRNEWQICPALWTLAYPTNLLGPRKPGLGTLRCSDERPEEGPDTGRELFWLQGAYFERGLHDLVARHLMERPFWDREHRDLPWTLETKSNNRAAFSDGIPLEELREAFSRFETDGRGDLAVAIWLHVTEEMLEREIAPQDAIDTFDLCWEVVERCGSETGKDRMKGLSRRLPSSTLGEKCSAWHAARYSRPVPRNRNAAPMPHIDDRHGSALTAVAAAFTTSALLRRRSAPSPL